MIAKERDICGLIQRKYSQFEYIGGYTNCSGFLYLLCVDCGTIFRCTAQIVRPAYKSGVCCPACKAAAIHKYRAEKAARKQAEIDARYERKFAERFNARYGCSFEYVCGYDRAAKNNRIMIRCKECGAIRERVRNKIFDADVNIQCWECGANRAGVMMAGCAECGEEFKQYTRQQLKCSECHAADERAKQNARKRLREARAKDNGEIDYSITLTRLIERDNHICALCGGAVNESDYVYVGDTFVAGNDYPSIDHIKPLSKGGLHQWKNVQLAHRLCNSIKCDKEEEI